MIASKNYATKYTIYETYATKYATKYIIYKIYNI